MNRRDLFKGFALGAGALLVPEPVKVYSFVGGWADRFTERTAFDEFGNVAIIRSYPDGRRLTRVEPAQTIDGVPLVPGGGFLRTSGDSPAPNGLWVARSGSWERSSDFG